MNLIPPAFHQFYQPPNSPPSRESLKWVISRGAEKKVNQFQAGNLDWFVSSTKVGFCSFTWPAGRINLPLMRVFVANWARLPPCPSCPRLLASRAQHMKCLFDESRSHSCQSSRAVLTGQSWCLLIERLDLAELDLEVYKRSQLPENLDENSKMVDRDEGWCWNWFAATVSSSGDICDFYETFENNPLRFIAQIQSSFSSPFFPADFPVCVSKCRQTVIVFTASVTGNQAPHLFASNIHWLNWIFGILNPPSQRPLLPCIVLENSFLRFVVLDCDTMDKQYVSSWWKSRFNFFLPKCTKCIAVSVSLWW